MIQVENRDEFLTQRARSESRIAKRDFKNSDCEFSLTKPSSTLRVLCVS